ncbi:ABC transporter permease [Vibrio sp. HA2012]|uniref:ABC transporter permease n=1 Tax=Vibrio sp. HA2012 TaxID=1971595 RepID=UPI000C2CC69E|nr:ABC transporter permease [Vibrio sp. HA2012]PJC86762.1 ABC transporter permease [Vibrio sp. HA2012]
MLWTMLRQSWAHDTGRKLLATTTVFLAAGLISALLAISVNIGDKMSQEMKSYGANIEISPEGQIELPEMLASHRTDLAKGDLLREKELPNIKDIFWRNNIIGFTPFVRGQVQAQKSSGMLQQINLTGTFFDQHIPVPDEPDYRTGNRYIATYWQVQGQWPDDEKPQALVGQTLAASQGWSEGDIIQLYGKNATSVSVTITGILSSGSDDETSLLVPLHIGQQLLDLQDRVQTVNVSALTVPENALSKKAREDLESLDSDEYDLWFCTAFVSSISFQLEGAMNNALVKPIWQVAASEGIVIGKIQSLLFVVTCAALVAAAMGIASLMTNAILQRAKEIGLMKSLGAHNWQVYLLFYSESVICGLLGGLLGCLAGWGLAKVMGYALFDSAVSFNWIIVPMVLVISVIITLIGTYFPSRRIASLYPIEVLYGRK